MIAWAVAVLLFMAGLAMVALRRQLLAMLLGLELMIAAANVALVHQAGVFADAETLSAVLLVIAVAAAEAVVGLTLILKVHQSGSEPDSGNLMELKG